MCDQSLVAYSISVAHGEKQYNLDRNMQAI